MPGVTSDRPSVTSLDELYRLVLTKYYGMFYQWGGSGPPRDYGIDCSGLVQRILQIAGICPPGDRTAESLYCYYLQHQDEMTCSRERGALAFFGTENHVVHVGWMIDEECMLSASGGGHTVVALQDAIAKNARVKIEPISRWKNPAFLAAVLPKYPF